MIAKKKNPKKKWKAVFGCKYNDDQAKEIGTSLEELKEELGEYKAVDLLEKAKNKNHRLHNYFEWENDIAAEKYRVQQAGYMMRSVRVIIKTIDGPREVPYVISIRSEIDNKRKYTTIARVLNNENYRAQAIKEAMKALNSWKNKYSMYKELTPIFQAIDEFNW